jgi:16S rRNA (guanine527-N7)-methyltransferase
MDKVVKDIPNSASPLTVSADLREKAAKIGVSIDQDQLNLFSTYYQELLFWNRRVNLVSARSAGEIVDRHFVDSLTSLDCLREKTGYLLDLGSGGGFPGIPLKIMLPRMKVFLVDSSRKKTSFLSHLVGILKLTETTVIRGRIEDLAANSEFIGKFDTVISRAAFKLDSLLLFACAFLKPGGQLIAMRGPSLDEAVIPSPRTAGAVGMLLTDESPQGPTSSHSPRKIVIYTRI